MSYPESWQVLDEAEEIVSLLLDGEEKGGGVQASYMVAVHEATVMRVSGWWWFAARWIVVDVD